MLSWSEWWQQLFSGARLPFTVDDARGQVQARATKWAQVGDHKVPELGDFTCLESWLMDTATADATKVLLEAQLNNCRTILQCAEDTVLTTEEVESGLRELASGGFKVPAPLVQWLDKNKPDFGEESISNCTRILKYEKLGVLMACRVDPAVDWVTYFLNCDHKITGAAQALFDRESGVCGDDFEVEISPLKK